MGRLTDTLQLSDADGFYSELVHLYDGLDGPAAEALSARLILILCNQVGDRQILAQAFALARAAGAPSSPTLQE
ncbi:hypothetical protein GCM10011611_54680 [Aliidongia dinghuensis]|uniref:DUF2783 domain-containing protein n=1 Tax=Aliidongia dinghuensis TaxID=1867774 RepID=A0A8J2YYJ6_9PROT|nr:DUF2783 domain-containing protein [Aliidongia dinghuensis]GGF41332.1 hypothetical protein GCM10011611_54680 [Aliidongia dinghuensis]